MKKEHWQAEKLIRCEQSVGELPIEFRVYARKSRSEIVVRVEKNGDTSRYAEWGMPKFMGIEAAMHQAALQTNENDLRP